MIVNRLACAGFFFTDHTMHWWPASLSTLSQLDIASVATLWVFAKHWSASLSTLSRMDVALVANWWISTKH